MSYSRVSHVSHVSHAPAPGGYPPPPPPPRPGFEQGYGGPPPPHPHPHPQPPPVAGPGYQGYFNNNFPPPAAHIHHSGPTRPFDSYENGCSSLLRGCLAALCCCCVFEQCFRCW